MPREMTAPELAARVRDGKPVLLIDVREDWEREIACLPGDIHVPLRRLPELAGDLAVPEGAEVVVYCHAGVRSWMAAGFLEQQGGLKDVASLAGGIDAWSVEVDPSLPRY